MMTLVGLIDIYVLNHFPGSVWSSLIGQSGRSGSASWVISLLRFHQQEPQEKRGRFGGVWTPQASSSPTTATHLGVEGFPWCLSSHRLPCPDLRFVWQRPICPVTSARTVVQPDIWTKHHHHFFLRASIYLDLSLKNSVPASALWLGRVGSQGRQNFFLL